jgi:hypothetical protein
MSITYLQAVNDVLSRLREASVVTVAQTTYSALLGKYINDSKRYVEDAWNWNAHKKTITVNTVAGTSTYVVTGSGLRHKGAVINNSTQFGEIRNAPLQWILDQQQLSVVQPSQPSYYAWNGNDGTDSKIELFATPDSAYALKVNLYVPQVDLVAEADVISLLPDAILHLAYARALVERGEDGGLGSSEAYQLGKSILADQIAIESGRYVENDCWVAV